MAISEFPYNCWGARVSDLWFGGSTSINAPLENTLMYGETIRLLLVDDDVVDAELITRVLCRSSDVNFEVTHAVRLSDGIDLLSKGPFDIVLLDLGLPDSCGFKSIARLHVQSPETPIFVLTGDDRRETGLAVIRAGAQDFLSKNELGERLLTRLAIHAILRQQQLVQARNEAMVDVLTGIANRRCCDAEFERHASGLSEHSAPLSVAIVDIDRFKDINDRCGHDAGDVVIRRVANILANGCREGDHVSRLGGEEFAVIMPNTTEEELLALMDILRLAICKFSFPGVESEVTVSVGAAQVQVDDDARTAFRRADQALYQAKQTGRNQVIVASQTELCRSVGF